MNIITHIEEYDSDRRDFNKWKRKSAGKWKYAVTGEWSTMSGTSGYHRFYYRVSEDRTYWALKVSGFPTRIVATAFTPDVVIAEELIGTMIRRVEQQEGGIWIEGIYDCADDIDVQVLWEAWKNS